MRTNASIAAALALTGIANPAQAMNWCALAELVPQSASDFDRVAPRVEGLTGCSRQPNDSAHESNWICPDDPATDAFERVNIHLLRVPDQGSYLMVAAFGLDDLDRIRRCTSDRTINGQTFSPGNVALRDRLTLPGLRGRLTLARIDPDGPAFIISDTRIAGEDPFVTGAMEGLFGITTVAYPSTQVQLAGLDPLDHSDGEIVAAFASRGAMIISQDQQNPALPSWTLSPPAGLAGVVQVKIDGFADHLLSAEYQMADTAAYERYIALLDDEYGPSRRQAHEGCTRRWWQSGQVSIRGEHCPDGQDRLTFYNDVASDQLQQYAAKLQRDALNQQSAAPAPTIDTDNF